MEYSVVSCSMVEAWAEHFGISLEDGSQWPGCLGSLRGIEKGEGEIPAELFQKDQETIDLFLPLTTAYFSVKDQEVPETVLVPIVHVEEAAPTEGGEAVA
jgi:hypothetical protein